MIQLRPPSLHKTYETFYSGDPAFVQPPAAPAVDASDEDKAAYEAAITDYRAKYTAAVERGDWSALAIEGQQPTKFVLGQVDRNIWRAIIDRGMLDESNPRHIGLITMFAVLFRLAIQSIPASPIEIRRRADDDWNGWVMATPDVVTALDELDPQIVGEIGAGIFRRLKEGVPGK
jgi:hypothetical protein